MLTREQQLEQQLAELRKAREQIIQRMDTVVNGLQADKDRLWNAIAPFLRSVLEKQLKNEASPSGAVESITFEKCMHALFGSDIFDLTKKLS